MAKQPVLVIPGKLPPDIVEHVGFGWRVVVYGDTPTQGSKKTAPVYAPGDLKRYGRKYATPIRHQIVDEHADRLKRFRARVKAACFGVVRPADMIPRPHPVAMTTTVWLPRPKSHYLKSGDIRPGALGWPTTKPDLSKLARAIEDALTNILYKDDSQVVVHNQAKLYVDRGDHPRVVVYVRRWVDVPNKYADYREWVETEHEEVKDG